MGCSPTGFKTFLVVCNIFLLFLGMAILSLGVKMKIALEALHLGQFPLLMNSVKAVVATGFLIAVTGGAGFCGACYEILWLVLVHLAGLGLIVVMEFCLGITLMVIKNTVEAVLEENNCGETCYNIVIYVVTKLASASSGTMLTLIIVQAFMIYSAVKLYYYLRDLPKNPPAAVTTFAPSVVIQNVQMQNMPAASTTQPQPMGVTVPSPPKPMQYGPQQPYMAPPPPYSQAQSESPSHSNAVLQQDQPPTVPPLGTSTLTRKAANDIV